MERELFKNTDKKSVTKRRTNSETYDPQNFAFPSTRALILTVPPTSLVELSFPHGEESPCYIKPTTPLKPKKQRLRTRTSLQNKACSGLEHLPGIA